MAHVSMVVGLGFGDEGKGSIVDYLTRKHEAKLVVRYNGGAQAAHNVVTPDGRHHTFSQWGSGTFAGAATFLSKHVVVNPLAMMREAQALAQHVENPWSLMHVDHRCLVTTPYHVIANRRKEEARGADRHGSCGMGVGETVAHAIDHPDEALRVDDIIEGEDLVSKLKRIAARMGLAGSLPSPWYIADEMHTWCDRLLAVTLDHWLGLRFREYNHVVFEGAQGVLLDQTYGFPPHHTWSDCTLANAIELAEGAESLTKIGVLRAFATRHGAGPLPTHSGYFAAMRKGDDGYCMIGGLEDAYNPTNPWQGPFRSGPFDVPLAKYAAKVCPVDQIALTHADVIDSLIPAKVCYRYADKTTEPTYSSGATLERQAELGSALDRASACYQDLNYGVAELRTIVEQATEAPVRLFSYGPTWKDKYPERIAT